MQLAKLRRSFAQLWPKFYWAAIDRRGLMDDVLDKVGDVKDTVMTAAAPALAAAGTAVGAAATTVGAVSSAVGDKITAIPVPPQVTSVYAMIFGEMPFGEFMGEFGPLVYVSVLPLLCIVFALCCNCSGQKSKMGARMLRRANLTVQGARWIGSGSAKKLLKGGYKGVDVEKGKSPLKNKAAVRARASFAFYPCPCSPLLTLALPFSLSLAEQGGGEGDQGEGEGPEALLIAGGVGVFCAEGFFWWNKERARVCEVAARAAYVF